MTNLDKQYLDLITMIGDFGYRKETRNGSVRSAFGATIQHNMVDGFPLLTCKKMAWKSIVTELLWFLRGDSDIRYLLKHNCNIWNGDAYAQYCKAVSKLENIDYSVHVDDPRQNKTRILTQEEFIGRIKSDEAFANRWANLGNIYGKQWRRWHTGWDVVEDTSREAGVRRVGYGVDQISKLIETLRHDPESRRMFVSAWNVNDIDSAVLPPCHTGFQVYTRELTHQERINLTMFEDCSKDQLDEANIPTRAISLLWQQRSADVPLGLPFNIASYGLLLTILGKMTNMIPSKLIGNLGDVHIYENQMDGVKKLMQRRCDITKLPAVKISDKAIFTGDIDDFLNSVTPDDFELVVYEHCGKIEFPLSN